MRIDPTGWAVGFTGCFVDFLITRRWRPILLGFLPLLIAVTVGGLVAWGSRLDHDTLAQRYLELGNSEVEAWENQWAPVRESNASAEQSAEQSVGESETAPQVDPSKTQIPRFAETLFRRVQQLHSDDQRAVFFVAMTLAQRGSLQSAIARLQTIAPNDREGYLPAHTKLVEIFLSRPIAPEELPAVKHHARAALRWDRTSSNLLSRISELFWKTGEHDAAVQSMSLAAQRDAKFNLPLAELALQDAKWKLQYQPALSKAEAYFTREVTDHPQDIKARLLLADVLMMKPDFAAAERLIVEGLKTDDDPSMRRKLSEIYRVQFVSTSKLTNTTWSGDIELLDRALRVDPTNNKVFEEVAKLARIGGTAPDADLMAQLRKLLADGKATSITHMWIAEHYLLTNKMEMAVPHLEQAVKRDPRAARCWNNLAYSLAKLYPERREEALTCADRAIALISGVAEFHDTRGTVLMALGRHKDAVAELERAIELVSLAPHDNPPNPGYHERLAISYEALGDKAMAEEHKQLAAEKQRQAKVQSEQTAPAEQTNPTEEEKKNSSGGENSAASAAGDAPLESATPNAISLGQP